MKFVAKTFLIVILMLGFIPNVLAFEEKRGYIASPQGNGINIRSGPGVSFDIVDSLPDGGVLTIVDETSSGDGCNDVWYQLEFNSSVAYACSTFIVLIEGTPGELDETFPEDYKLLLEDLQKIYPNAIFKPVYATNSITTATTLGLHMSFETAVYNQYYTQNKSLIWDSNGSRDGWKNILSYHYDTNTFRNDYSGGGATWFSASEEIISYYLDPRNFLNEEDIFMFESLAYDASVHTIEGVENILKGTYMETEMVDSGSQTFAEVIYAAGKETNVSPYFLASRIRLEVGTTRSGLVLGTYTSYPEFNGYYNYYNIGAGGTNVIYNGLKFAKDSGWNSEYTAIMEGAKWIKSDYVQSGDSTNYTQKWDVFCEGRTTCFNKQYMQNIQAPATEAQETYDAYSEILKGSMYEVPFIFYIPVFKDMEESYEIPSTLNPISYIDSISINGKVLSNFHGLTYNYEIYVPFNTTSVNVEAITKVSGATTNGTGDILITSDKQIIEVVGVALNGDKTTYKITVNKLEEDSNLLTLDETLESLKTIRVNDDLMSGATSVDVVKESFYEVNPNALVTVKDKDGKVISSGNIKTGDIVYVKVLDEEVEFKYVLYGDINGDSNIDIVDLLLVQKHLLNATNLVDEYKVASDINKDSNIDIVDLLLVQKHLLGSSYINQ